MVRDPQELAEGKTKLVHEQVLAMLQTAASGALNIFAEPEAVVVTVAWHPALGDGLPAGFVLSRKGEQLGSDVILRCVQQLSRMQETLLRSLDSHLYRRRQIIESQEKLAHERKERSNQEVSASAPARPAGDSSTRPGAE